MAARFSSTVNGLTVAVGFWTIRATLLGLRVDEWFTHLEEGLLPPFLLPFLSLLHLDRQGLRPTQCPWCCEKKRRKMMVMMMREA